MLTTKKQDKTPPQQINKISKILCRLKKGDLHIMTATKNIKIKKMIPPTIAGGPYPLEPRLLTTKQTTTPPKQSNKISKPKFVQANLEKSK